jgi:hypothetical protein
LPSLRATDRSVLPAKKSTKRNIAKVTAAIDDASLNGFDGFELGPIAYLSIYPLALQNFNQSSPNFTSAMQTPEVKTDVLTKIL